METTTKTITVKTWTARNGEVRHYVQGVADIAAKLAGGLSNAKYTSASRARVWLDESGTVHVDSYALATFYGFGTKELTAYIQAAQVVGTDTTAAPRTATVSDPSARAWARGASYGVNGQIWDEDI